MSYSNAQYSDLLRAVNQYGSAYNYGDPQFVNPYSGAAYSPGNYREIMSRKSAPVDPRSAYTDYKAGFPERLATGSLGYQFGSKGLEPAAKGIYSSLAQKSYAGSTGGLTLGSTIYGATRDQNPYEVSPAETFGNIAGPAAMGHTVGGMISAGAQAGPIGAAVGALIGLFMHSAQQKKAKQASIDAEKKFQEERTEYREDVAKQFEKQREQFALGREADLWGQEASKYANQYGAYANPYGQSYYDKGGKLIKKKNNYIEFDNGGLFTTTESLPVDSMFNRQLFTESSFNPSAESSAGALGLSQITEPTFNDMIGWGWVPEGKKFSDLKTDTDLAVNLQERYMNDLMSREWNQGSEDVVKAKALAAYNMGPTALVNVLNKEKEKGTDIYNSLDWVNNLSNYKKGYKETTNYVNKIMLGGNEKFEKEYTAAWKAGGKDYNKGGYIPKYQEGGKTEGPFKSEMQQEHIREFEHLSKQYKQRVYDWESSMGRDWRDDHSINKSWRDEMSAMRGRLWELSRLVQADKQSNPGAFNAPIDIQGGGTFEYSDDYWQESQTPLFSTKRPKQKPIPKIPIKKAKSLPVPKMKEPVLAKAGDAPEYTTPTVDEDLSKNFHHRKYKEEDGKYSMFNPNLGKWKPITKKSYESGIKNSAYNEETDVYEQWWHKGRTKKDSITDGSILEYLKQNTYDKGGKVSEVTNDPTFKVWYASNAKRPDVMATTNTQELLQLFLVDINMDQMPLFSGEIDKHGNIDKSKRPLDLSLKILENPDYKTGGKINTVAEFTGNEMIVNNQAAVEAGIKENNPSKAAAPIRLAMQKGFVTPGQETHGSNPMSVDDQGFIYTKGGKLPFRVRKGAGIYDHATDQFKQGMTDEQIMAVAKNNINKWEKNNMN